MTNTTKQAVAVANTVAAKVETLEAARVWAKDLRARGFGVRLVEREGFVLVFRTAEAVAAVVAVDVRVSGWVDFATTDVTFEAVSERALEFFARSLGGGAVSFTTPKSACYSALDAMLSLEFKLETVLS